jgi:hypothetical protein
MHGSPPRFRIWRKALCPFQIPSCDSGPVSSCLFFFDNLQVIVMRIFKPTKSFPTLEEFSKFLEKNPGPKAPLTDHVSAKPFMNTLRRTKYRENVYQDLKLTRERGQEYNGKTPLEDFMTMKG